MESVKSEITEIIKRAQGHVGFYYKNLVTDQKISVNEADNFDAASIIKLPMLVSVWAMIEEGKVKLTDKTVIGEVEKVDGCGCFSLMPGNISVTIEGLLNTMIALSDNTATNKLLSLYTIEEFNRMFRKLGLNKTRLSRFLFDQEAKKTGLENNFCLKEVMDLLENVYRRKLLGEEASSRILDTLCRQQINHKIPSMLPAQLKIAHKTGEDIGISHDIGIVFAREPYLIGLVAVGANVPLWEDAMRKISLVVYEGNEEMKQLKRRE